MCEVAVTIQEVSITFRQLMFMRHPALDTGL